MNNSSLLDVLERLESKLDWLASQNSELNSEMKEMLIQIAANKCPCQSSTGTLSSTHCSSNIEVDQCIDLLYTEAVATLKTDLQLIKAMNSTVAPVKPVVAVARSEPSSTTSDVIIEKHGEKGPEPTSPSSKGQSISSLVKDKLMPALKLTTTKQTTTSKPTSPEVKRQKAPDATGHDQNNGASPKMTLRSGKIKAAGKEPAAASSLATITTSQPAKPASKKGQKKHTSSSSLLTAHPPPSASGSSTFNRRAAVKRIKSAQQPSPNKSMVASVTRQLIASGAIISPISRFKHPTLEEVVPELYEPNNGATGHGSTGAGTDAADPKKPVTGVQFSTPPNFDNKPAVCVADRRKVWENRSTKI